MIERLHSSKRNVEREWGEKDLEFLQDQNKDQWLGRKEFLFIDSLRQDSLSRRYRLKRDNG